jgi:hypothetical protein
LNLLADLVVDAPKTEGIKYAGSKLKLLPHILQLVQKVNPHTVLDGFSGTTRVSQALAQAGHQLIANDISVWSEVFGKCYLLNDHSPEHYQPLIGHLNALPGQDGWFTENYGGESNGGCSIGEDGLKKPWQKHNTRRLDAIREEIDRLTLSDVERAVVLTSLILALDEVESTLGHFASYLNDWSPRAAPPATLGTSRGSSWRHFRRVARRGGGPGLLRPALRLEQRKDAAVPSPLRCLLPPLDDSLPERQAGRLWKSQAQIGHVRHCGPLFF